MSGVPLIDAIGAYTLRAPFTLDANAIYACKAIESFDTVERQGESVYERYYLPNNLTQEDYTRDLNANVKIVTLISTTGHAPIVVPSSYIASFPSKSLVPYSDLVISLGLGLVPDSASVEALKQTLSQGVQDTLGIEPTVQLHRLPLKGGVDFGTHQRLTQARANLMQYRPTPQANQQYWSGRLAELEAEVARLEAALVATQTA